MFYRMNSRSQTFSGVSGHDGHRFLREDRAVVDLLIYEMDGHARGRCSRFQCHSDGVAARIPGQQRWMNIDDPIRKPVDGRRTEDPHEARQDHRVNVMTIDDCEQATR